MNTPAQTATSVHHFLSIGFILPRCHSPYIVPQAGSRTGFRG